MKLLCLVLFLFNAGAQASVPKLPHAPLRPVIEEYQGTKITDPYRWLENSKDADVQKWTKAQATYAQNFLEKLPKRAAFKDKLQKWSDAKSPSYGALSFHGGTYFALKLQPPKNQPVLVALTSLDDLKTERVILDPNVIDSKGTTSIDFYVPSLDGKLVAVSLSHGGSEIGTVHVYQTVDGKELPDQIPFVNKPTAGGSVAWNKDGSGFYYTRYPRDGERRSEDMNFYQQVYFHKMGTATKDDTYAIGKEFPRIAEIELETSADGKYTLAIVSNGDGGEYAHYVLNETGKWTQITQFSDKVKQGHLGYKNDLYLVSLAGAERGKILHLTLDKPELKRAKTIVKESGDAVVKEILPTPKALYISYMAGGPSEIRVFDANGKAKGQLPVLPLSDSSSLTAAKDGKIVFRTQSYVKPSIWYEATPGENKVRATALVMTSPVDFSDVEVTREMARSKDGTMVPMTLIYKKGMKRNNTNPTILYGYGGYGISLSPRFRPELYLWLEQGGVMVVANLRGGGEFGESWHLSGNLTKKQNVFDDFIACAEHLIQTGVTSNQKLAIEGGSNGGLLMGAAMTQRPELFRAVVAHVGIYDMLRVETDPNGAFNVTEFGTVKDPQQFKALYSYSPMHKVKDGAAYPATLLLTGVNDGRVNPYHSKKMAARLQVATASGHPVLLRVTFDGGHGMGRSVSQRVSQDADVYAFLHAQLSM